MPHLPIILDCKAFLDQVDQYHETITENIAADAYKESDLTAANELLNSAIVIAETTKAALEVQVGNMETFLGI